MALLTDTTADTTMADEPTATPDVARLADLRREATGPDKRDI